MSGSMLIIEECRGQDEHGKERMDNSIQTDLNKQAPQQYEV